MFSNIRADLARLSEFKQKSAFRQLIESLLFDNGFTAVLLYRMAHWFKSRSIPFFGPLFCRLSILLTGVEIAPATKIGPGLMISHGQGVVIGQWSKIGSGVTILHQVTLGGAVMNKLEDMPTVGDNVFIGAGAKLIGNITIGDGAFIGVDALVSRDIPAGSKVLSAGGISVRPPKEAEADSKPG